MKKYNFWDQSIQCFCCSEVPDSCHTMHHPHDCHTVSRMRGSTGSGYAGTGASMRVFQGQLGDDTVLSSFVGFSLFVVHL